MRKLNRTEIENILLGCTGMTQAMDQLEVKLSEEVNAQLTQTMQQLLAEQEKQP